MIADFLKGTVDESLKKLVQPAAVVPATLFVLLNLAFIYPAAQGAGAAKAFAGLDKTWQAVVAATAIVALGYVLLNAANMVIDTLAGQTWRHSALNWWWRKRQREKRKRLEERIKEEEKDGRARLGLRWELATHYPSLNVDKTLQATRLGNVLVATQHTIWSRYRLDVAAFWAPLEASKELKEAPAIVSVKDEKSTLDLLANLTLVSALFGVEALVFFSARENWRASALSLLALVGAYVAYRLAVESARSWGDAMQVVVDLHRGELRKGLGLREPKGIADERKLWEGARRLYLPGETTPPPPDLFQAEELAALKVTSAAALTVEQAAVAVVDALVDESPAAPQPPLLVDTYAALLRYVDYSLVASRKEETGDTPLDIVIADPRVRRVRQPPDVVVDGVEAKADVRPVGARDELRWRITGLGAGASLALGFRLPLWRLTFAGNAPRPKVGEHTGGFQFVFPRTSKDKTVTVELESFAVVGARSPKVTVNGEEEFVDLVDAEAGRFCSQSYTLVGDDKLWIELPVAP